jgi:hypothetical protein
VIDACGMSRPIECLGRHMLGDWDELCEDDKAANDATARTATASWIITEADRSVTTLLLPDEY